MKRILLSLGTLVFVGALALGATGAFFSDTETSTGNTFTAGAIDLKVDSTSHYDGLVCSQITAGIFHWIQDPNMQGNSRPDLLNQPCDGTWTETDLGPSNKFFNFPDIKPGDNGEDTISLHVINNDAWACADIKTTSNKDNDCTSPENTAEGAGICGSGDPNANGDLAQNLFVFAWVDNASSTSTVPGTPGDNIWQAGEKVLTPTPLALSGLVNGTTTLPLADSTTGTGPLSGGATNYVGMAWCAGTMNVSVPGTITCNGVTMDNKAQTDSATADVVLRVTQARNQSNFKCNPVIPS